MDDLREAIVRWLVVSIAEERHLLVEPFHKMLELRLVEHTLTAVLVLHQELHKLHEHLFVSLKVDVLLPCIFIKRQLLFVFS